MARPPTRARAQVRAIVDRLDVIAAQHLTFDQDEPFANEGGGSRGAHRLRRRGLLDRWYLLISITVLIALVPVGYALLTDDGPKQTPPAVLPSVTTGLGGLVAGGSPDASVDSSAVPVASDASASPSATARASTPKPGTSTVPATLTISATATLQRGQSWRTTSTVVSLTTDGDLVVTNASGTQLWHSDTGSHNPNRSGNRAVFQNDGNLVVYDSAQRSLWTSGTAGHPGAVLVVQSGAACVVDSGRRVWCTTSSQG